MAHVPSIPALRYSPLEEIAAEIERIRATAEVSGFGTLAWLLECALIEARGQIAVGEREAKASIAEPDDLWRPVDR